MTEYLSSLDLDWVAVQAIAVSMSSLLLVVTAIVGVRQLRQSAKSAQFDAVIQMEELVDSFREGRRQLFENLPLELAFTSEQFAVKTPPRSSDGTYTGSRKALLTPEQVAGLESMTDDDLSGARRVITRLSDLGQLIEDGYFPKRTFYGKHHVMVLRTCHMVEPIRQHLEAENEGGNYGRTLLTMRKTAARYYDRSPKHSDVAAVHISNQQGSRAIYQTKPSLWRSLRGRS